MQEKDDFKLPITAHPNKSEITDITPHARAPITELPSYTGTMTKGINTKYIKALLQPAQQIGKEFIELGTYIRGQLTNRCARVA